MKPLTFRILLCLLLGVVTTVGVAIVCWQAQLVTFGGGHQPRFNRDVVSYPPGHSLELKELLASTASSWDIEEHGNIKPSVAGVGIGLEWILFETQPHGPIAFLGEERRIEVCQRVGWPMICLAGYLSDSHRYGVPGWRAERESLLSFLRDRVEQGFDSSNHPDEIPIMVPFHPIFPGLLLNTGIYAAIWFVLLVCIGPARHTLRRWRGRCPACGYNLRGELATGCPECGWGREV